MTNVWNLFEYVAYAFATKKLRSATIESHLSAIKFFHRIFTRLRARHHSTRHHERPQRCGALACRSG